jgi:hypothetical protein
VKCLQPIRVGRSRRSHRDKCTEIKEVEPADESGICECLVLFMEKSGHLIDGTILGKSRFVS